MKISSKELYKDQLKEVKSNSISYT